MGFGLLIGLVAGLWAVALACVGLWQLRIWQLAKARVGSSPGPQATPLGTDRASRILLLVAGVAVALSLVPMLMVMASNR